MLCLVGQKSRTLPPPARHIHPSGAIRRAFRSVEAPVEGAANLAKERSLNNRVASLWHLFGGPDIAAAGISLVDQTSRQLAHQQIAREIERHFTGHDLARLVGAVLEAEGYRTEVSPPGPDGGVDILAGRGPLGFEEPRLCVQVKSSSGHTEVPVLRALQGSMQTFSASQGMLVCWGGFTWTPRPRGAAEPLQRAALGSRRHRRRRLPHLRPASRRDPGRAASQESLDLGARRRGLDALRIRLRINATPKPSLAPLADGLGSSW